MARVPLILGPGHGRTFTMDLDGLEKMPFFVFCEDSGVMYIKEDEYVSQEMEALSSHRVKYHRYDVQKWQGHGKEGEQVFVSLWHSDCWCLSG